MKTSLLVLALMLWISAAFGQYEGIKKTWIGKEMELLKISDTSASFDITGCTQGNSRKYSITGDVLTIYWHQQVKMNGPVEHFERSFKIVKLTADTLILLPASVASNYMMDKNLHRLPWTVSDTSKTNIRQLVFVDSAKINDTRFRFGRFVMNGTLDIDSTGKIFYYGLLYGSKTQTRQLYQGQLSPEEMDSLMFLLKHSALDNLPEHPTSTMADGQPMFFTFYYNGKVKKSMVNMPPVVFQQLAYFTYNIYKRPELTVCSAVHDFK